MDKAEYKTVKKAIDEEIKERNFFTVIGVSQKLNISWTEAQGKVLAFLKELEDRNTFTYEVYEEYERRFEETPQDVQAYNEASYGSYRTKLEQYCEDAKDEQRTFTLKEIASACGCSESAASDFMETMTMMWGWRENPYNTYTPPESFSG